MGILGSMPSVQPAVGRHPIIGNVHAITMMCRNGHRIFDSPANAGVAMQLLGSMDREGLTTSLAWVIMPDHIHWMAQLRGHSPGYCVHRFKARSSFLINRQRGRAGGLWQPGHHDDVIGCDASLRRHARHILANPVRAGLAAQLGEHPYGWCRWTLSDLEAAGEGG